VAMTVAPTCTPKDSMHAAQAVLASEAGEFCTIVSYRPYPPGALTRPQRLP
jgi:hypothetical protein